MGDYEKSVGIKLRPDELKRLNKMVETSPKKNRSEFIRTRLFGNGTTESSSGTTDNTNTELLNDLEFLMDFFESNQDLLLKSQANREFLIKNEVKFESIAKKLEGK